ncbi:unnamed protein product [Blumeria hordei]|uniref:Uncharacterized protein n=1 Tax=Blumeria hordei TaxID=2867405 RepID=A0A383UYR4_BLUHO|nr:unnamed protein product [Blumeria hordei]
MICLKILKLLQVLTEEGQLCVCSSLCYLSLRLSSTLSSSLAQAALCTVLLFYFVTSKIIDILPLMNSHSAQYLPMEFGHIFYVTFYPQKIKMVAMEAACAGKSLKKTYTLSQARPRHWDHTMCAYSSISYFFVTLEANLIKSFFSVSGAGYAPENYRMTSPLWSRVGDEEDFDPTA